MASQRTRVRGELLPDRLQPRRLPAQERSRALVDALLTAGARVLVEKGWEALTMKEVGAVAGVAPGSLYQYFPDKAALVAALVEQQSERELAFQLEHLSRAPAASGGAVGLEETLGHVVRGLLLFQASEGPLMRATLRAMPFLGRHPALVDRVAQVAAGLRALLGAHLPQLSERELELTTHVLTNAVHSLTHDGALARPDWLDDDTLARSVLRLVRGFLREVP